MTELPTPVNYQQRSSPEPSMDWKAIHGPASCSSHADMVAQLTSLMDDGMTVYCGLGASPAVTPSSPFGTCSRPWLADELSLLTFLRRSVLAGGGACKWSPASGALQHEARGHGNMGMERTPGLACAESESALHPKGLCLRQASPRRQPSVAPPPPGC